MQQPQQHNPDAKTCMNAQPDPDAIKAREHTKARISEILEALPAGELRQRLGVKAGALRQAKHEGIFRPGWWLVVSSMCQREGLRCDESLFSFSDEKVESQSEGGVE